MRLARSFFARDTRNVARELLGARLVRVLDHGTKLIGRIMEVEAYCPGDTASHGYRRQTERNAAMFARPGTAYVYFTYGMHYCFNIVTESEGVPAAVLIRALEPVAGIDEMLKNRSSHIAHPVHSVKTRDICRGPARLCQALLINRAFNGYDMHQPNSTLYVERGRPYPADQVFASPRIGVRGDAQAVSVQWRWYVAGNPFVSGSSGIEVHL